jgi:hypothetical protein
MPSFQYKYGALCGNWLEKNNIFNLESSGNRDNCYYPYYQLRNSFLDHGVQINTIDCCNEDTIYFELHHDVLERKSSAKKYLLLLETDLVHPRNQNKNFSNYSKIFTWNDNIIDNDKYYKINFPNNIRIPNIDGFNSRDRFCCVIAANKTLYKKSINDLYLERIKSIRWFEKNAPEDFDLYGIGWDIPAIGSGLVGKVIRRLLNQIPFRIWKQPFSSYRGKIAQKHSVLARTRFSLCYENVAGLPGYITEKIFDSFFAGCVPVYWGASNVFEHIPENCFIDRRRFSSMDDLYQFLKSIDESTYCSYQDNIRNFLKSDASRKFSSEYFASTIVSVIISDLADER